MQESILLHQGAITYGCQRQQYLTEFLLPLYAVGGHDQPLDLPPSGSCLPLSFIIFKEKSEKRERRKKKDKQFSS